MSEIKKYGCRWLEPMEEFIKCAQRAQKIAKSKKKNKMLKAFCQKIGLRVNLLTT